MKICNLGYARSRTSLLTTQLVNYYGCIDMDETYTNIRKKTYIKNYFTQKHTNIEQKYLQLYKQNVINFTNDMFEQDSFIVKLWPRWMNSSEFTQNFDTLILDLNYTFRFSDYDKIFVTVRDPVDALCSLWLATRYGYNFRDPNKANYFTKRKLENNNVMPNIFDNQWHLAYLTEIFLMDKICEYLNVYNINYVYLNYNDIPDYLEKNYKLTDTHPNLQIMPIDTQVDYQIAVKNYREVSEQVYNFQKQILPRINNIAFK